MLDDLNSFARISRWAIYLTPKDSYLHLATLNTQLAWLITPVVLASLRHQILGLCCVSFHLIGVIIQPLVKRQIK